MERVSTTSEGVALILYLANHCLRITPLAASVQVCCLISSLSSREGARLLSH